MASMPNKRMGTAASELRCRCVYLHHGPDPFGPTEYKGVWHDDLPRSLAPTGSGLRLVSSYPIVGTVGERPIDGY
jgi:hypothetical protein